MTLFMFAVCGNLATVVSILLWSIDSEYLVGQLPYLLGRCVAVTLAWGCCSTVAQPIPSARARYRRLSAAAARSCLTPSSSSSSGGTGTRGTASCKTSMPLRAHRAKGEPPVR